MPITPFKKVASREIYGADISGLQDAVNKMEAVLDMQTASAVNHAMQPVSDQEEPALHRRIYEGTIRNWLETPAPVIRRNAVVVPVNEYVLYAAQGGVVFHQQQAADAVITADFTHMRAESPLSGHAGAGGVAHPAATTEIAGFMSAGDKQRFDALDYMRYRRAGQYHAGINAADMATAAVAANALDMLPFYVPVAQTFDRIAINVTTAAAGNARLGVFADDGTVYPSSLIVDAGEVDTGATGIRWLSISLSLIPGLYWLARIHNATPTLRSLFHYAMIPLGSTDLGTAMITGYRVTQAYGTLPAVFPTGAAFITSGRPAVFLRRA
jgi:hypothetical protein